jgi:hypothetical protein
MNGKENNMNKPSLKDILIKDANTAKTQGGIVNEVLAPGNYVAKVLGFTEEEAYQFVSLEINKKKFNFFYNYYLRNTTDLDASLINWIKALATIPVKESTSLLEIANSAIGSSFKITIYNYVSKTGKNAGKTQHAISFKDKPVLETTTIETEQVELPF